jgi:hypothetical protein
MPGMDAVIRITQGEATGTFVSQLTGFPLPTLRGQKWFLFAEHGGAFRFLVDAAAAEMLAHLNKHGYKAELVPWQAGK